MQPTKEYIASKTRYGKMKYNRCGKSGLLLPAISLGLWHNFGSTASYNVMEEICRTAFDNGITHFDLANNYGPPQGAAEENFGQILKGGLDKYRDEMIISTKAGYEMWKGPYGNWGSRKHLIASLDQSLSRMALDYVDIFYHHRVDPSTPIEETAEALDSVVRQGKALYIGLSNYNKEQTQAAQKVFEELKTPYIINQRRYSMLDRTLEEDGTLEYAAGHGIGVIVFSPLAQGLLTGKYLDGIPNDSRIRTDGRFLKETSLTKEVLDKVGALNEIAKERGESLAQIALAWVLRGKVTSAIIGVSKAQQVLDNLAVLDSKPFTAEEEDKIDKITRQQLGIC